MNQRLVLCSDCQRHVRFGEVCPFCGGASTHGPLPEERDVRLHRAALVGLSIAVAVSVSMCAPYGISPVDVQNPDVPSTDVPVTDAPSMDASSQD
jgi:hypothetical protein